MGRRRVGHAVDRAPAPLLVVVAACSFQGGAALATTIFDEVGPLGAVTLRVAFGAAILLALHPGLLRRRPRGELRWVLLLAVVLAGLNASFYEAIERVPLGVVVTVEFLGPLGIAIAGSRRARDFLWVVLAALGVALLGSPTVDVDLIGFGFALAAATCFAGYIVVGKRVTASWNLSEGLTVSMALAAVLLLPLGIPAGGSGLLELHVLAAGVGVALLASVLPYMLELAALRRMRTSTFGIVVSLEPAIAALAGLVLLAQALDPFEWLAVVLVTIASIGANRDARGPMPHEA